MTISFPSAAALRHASFLRTLALTTLASLSLVHGQVLAQDKPKVPTAPATGPAAATKPVDGGKAPPSPPVVKRSSTEKTVGKAIQVGALNKAEIPKSCGCAFYKPTSARDNGPMLLWLDNQGRAQMQLDGKRELFKMTSERMVKRRKDSEKLSAGDRILVTLRSEDAASGLQASVASSAERNCTISAALCSAPTFKSLITLSKGESRKSMAAFSVCSCPGSSKPFTPAAPVEKSASKDAPASAAAKPTAVSNPRPAVK